MRLIEGRAEARWLPSRHYFALFRLAAYLRLRHAEPRHFQGLLMADAHQSTFETYAVGTWYTATAACFAAVLAPAGWPVPAKIALGFVIALTAVQATIVVVGAVVLPLWSAATRRPNESQMRINSFVLMLLLFAAAIALARYDSWERLLAWQCIALFGANAVAAVIAFTLRRRIAELEAPYGGSPSAS